MSQNRPGNESDLGGSGGGGSSTGSGGSSAGTGSGGFSSGTGSGGGSSVGGGGGTSSSGGSGGTGLSTTGGGAGAGTATAPASGIGAKAKEYGQTVADAASTARDYITDKASVVGDKISGLKDVDYAQYADQAKDYARQNPGQALLVAAAAGFVIGLLVRGGRR